METTSSDDSIFGSINDTRRKKFRNAGALIGSILGGLAAWKVSEWVQGE